MLPVINKNNEKEKNKTEDKLNIILLSNKSIFLTTIDLKTSSHKTMEVDFSHIFSFNCIEMKKNNFFVVGNKCTSYITDLFTNQEAKEYKLIDDISFFNSIKINDNIIALISNSFYENGTDELMFYNLKKKKLVQNVIKGYSFSLNPNGLELMPKLDTNNKKRILLCACKRYIKSQRNGILLVNPQLGENKDVEIPFYDTGNFEVNCFCPILKELEKQNEKNDQNDYLARDDQNKQLKKKIFEDTNYFLVGGFDENKRQGAIRLYKVIYGEKAYNTTIEYIQDIVFKKQKNIDDFDMPINCLTQSRTTGNILVNCYNGNIYLLTPPNIDYYLAEDKEEEEEKKREKEKEKEKEKDKEKDKEKRK